MTGRAVGWERVPVRRLEMALEDPASPPGRILRAAEDVFAEQGFKAATTREIARRAGVNIATIHYYWGSKDELWGAVLYHVMTRITELTQGLLDHPPDDLAGGITQIIGSLVDIFADHPNYPRLLQRRALEGASTDLSRELSLAILDIGLEFVNQHKLEGLSVDFDPSLVLFGLQGSLRIFFQDQDSVEAIFGEDPSCFSPAFRQKLKDLISSLALLMAGLQPVPDSRRSRRRNHEVSRKAPR